MLALGLLLLLRTRALLLLSLALLSLALLVLAGRSRAGRAAPPGPSLLLAGRAGALGGVREDLIAPVLF